MYYKLTTRVERPVDSVISLSVSGPLQLSLNENATYSFAVSPELPGIFTYDFGAAQSLLTIVERDQQTIDVTLSVQNTQITSTTLTVTFTDTYDRSASTTLQISIDSTNYFTVVHDNSVEQNSIMRFVCQSRVPELDNYTVTALNGTISPIDSRTFEYTSSVIADDTITVTLNSSGVSEEFIVSVTPTITTTRVARVSLDVPTTIIQVTTGDLSGHAVSNLNISSRASASTITSPSLTFFTLTYEGSTLDIFHVSCEYWFEGLTYPITRNIRFSVTPHELELIRIDNSTPLKYYLDSEFVVTFASSVPGNLTVEVITTNTTYYDSDTQTISFNLLTNLLYPQLFLLRVTNTDTNYSQEFNFSPSPKLVYIPPLAIKSGESVITQMSILGYPPTLIRIPDFSVSSDSQNLIATYDGLNLILSAVPSLTEDMIETYEVAFKGETRIESITITADDLPAIVTGPSNLRYFETATYESDTIITSVTSNYHTIENITDYTFDLTITNFTIDNSVVIQFDTGQELTINVTAIEITATWNTDRLYQFRENRTFAQTTVGPDWQRFGVSLQVEYEYANDADIHNLVVLQSDPTRFEFTAESPATNPLHVTLRIVTSTTSIIVDDTEFSIETIGVAAVRATLVQYTFFNGILDAVLELNLQDINPYNFFYTINGTRYSINEGIYTELSSASATIPITFAARETNQRLFELGSYVVYFKLLPTRPIIDGLSFAAAERTERMFNDVILDNETTRVRFESSLDYGEASKVTFTDTSIVADSPNEWYSQNVRLEVFDPFVVDVIRETAVFLVVGYVESYNYYDDVFSAFESNKIFTIRYRGTIAVNSASLSTTNNNATLSFDQSTTRLRIDAINENPTTQMNIPVTITVMTPSSGNFVESLTNTYVKLAEPAILIDGSETNGISINRSSILSLSYTTAIMQYPTLINDSPNLLNVIEYQGNFVWKVQALSSGRMWFRIVIQLTTGSQYTIERYRDGTYSRALRAQPLNFTEFVELSSLITFTQDYHKYLYDLILNRYRMSVIAILSDSVINVARILQYRLIDIFDRYKAFAEAILDYYANKDTKYDARESISEFVNTPEHISEPFTQVQYTTSQTRTRSGSKRQIDAGELSLNVHDVIARIVFDCRHLFALDAYYLRRVTDEVKLEIENDQT